MTNASSPSRFSLFVAYVFPLVLALASILGMLYLLTASSSNRRPLSTFLSKARATPPSLPIRSHLPPSTSKAALPVCLTEEAEPYNFPMPRIPWSGKPAASPDWRRGESRPFFRGISLGMHFQDQSYDYDWLLRDIAKTGASHVSFVISWYQKDVRSNDVLRHETKTISDSRLIRTIHQARARGLQIFLLPIVRLRERGPDDWRGVIKPADLEAWWHSYRAYILHYARLSQEHGVELFSVGSELVSMEKHRHRWLELIHATRDLFGGPLIYSANWDHYEPVTFWDALDFIGISNYYELSKKIHPPLAELRKTWAELREKIETWKRRYPRQPLLFTEVGYYSQEGTNIYPWDYTRNQALSLSEQTDCYRAFTDVWKQSPVLRGIFVWNWFGSGGLQDKGYTPRGKPAECILRDFFAAIQRRETPPPRTP